MFFESRLKRQVPPSGVLPSSLAKRTFVRSDNQLELATSAYCVQWNQAAGTPTDSIAGRLTDYLCQHHFDSTRRFYNGGESLFRSSQELKEDR